MAAALLVLTLLASTSLSPVAATTVTPIEKVIQLLSDLEGKIIEEGKQAQKVYDDFAEFCEDRSKELGFEIKDGKAQVAELGAVIEKADAGIEALNTKIEEVAASIATDEKDLKAATAIRAKEAEDFAKEKAELLEIIDMLERAAGILKKEMAKGPSMLQTQLKSAGSLVQAFDILVQASALGAADAAKLTALVQRSSQAPEDADDEEDAAVGAPAAAAYESHSAGIVETIENLQEKAEEQLSELEKKETASLHNFELMEQAIKDEVKYANKELAEAKEELASTTEAKAAATGELEVTSKDLKEDTEERAKLHNECMKSAEDFEAATKSRGEELKALAEAKKVIKEKTAGAAELAYGLDQVSFMQVGSQSRLASSADLAGFEAVRFIRDLARKDKSTMLAQLASRVAESLHDSTVAGQDPFAKVKGLISDMIQQLEDDAAAEATQKAYCDKEMAETSAKKEEKSAEIQKLSTKIDKDTALSAKLKEEVAVLQKELAELIKAQADMDALRQEENEAFVKNKADMEAGLAGVKLALKVLREYYAKEDKAHDAAEGAGSGIIGLLEVVESDFSKGLTEMVVTEESAATEYETQTKENEIAKATKEQDIKYKTKEVAALDKAVSQASADREGVQTELDAILEYWKSLQEQCVAKAETYEERKARRDSEIAGLKEALQILGGEAVLIQRSSHRALRGVHHHF